MTLKTLKMRKLDLFVTFCLILSLTFAKVTGNSHTTERPDDLEVKSAVTSEPKVISPQDEVNSNSTSQPEVTSPDVGVKSKLTSGGQGHHHRHHHRRLVHRKSDDESKVKFDGVWEVLDPGAPKNRHNKTANCILLQMRVSIVIPLQHPDGTVSNKTIVVPDHASVNGNCGEAQERITLMWNNTHDSGKLVKEAQLTMLFDKKMPENAIYLTGVWVSLDLFLEDGVQTVMENGIPSQNLMLGLKNVELWRTPNRFAFVCDSGPTVALSATTLPLQPSQGEDLIIDPVFNEEAFLVFHELSVETFRHNRFGQFFTHLKYDCRKKWAYDFMPFVVGIALAALVVFDLTIFLLRKKLGCDPVTREGENENPAVPDSEKKPEKSGEKYQRIDEQDED